MADQEQDADGVVRVELDIQARVGEGEPFQLCTVTAWDRTAPGLMKRVASSLRQIADAVENSEKMRSLLDG